MQETKFFNNKKIDQDLDMFVNHTTYLDSDDDIITFDPDKEVENLSKDKKEKFVSALSNIFNSKKAKPLPAPSLFGHLQKEPADLDEITDDNIEVLDDLDLTKSIDELNQNLNPVQNTNQIQVTQQPINNDLDLDLVQDQKPKKKIKKYLPIIIFSVGLAFLVGVILTIVLTIKK